MKKKIDELLEAAFKLSASDIHLTVGVPPIFRVHGDLKRYGAAEIDNQFTEMVAQLTIPDKMYPDFIEHGQIDYSYEVPGVARFRVNAFQQRGSVSLAFRTIPTKIPTIDELQLPETLKTLAKTTRTHSCDRSYRSGKSTTLAAMIKYMNETMRKHIITLEDPIEYMHAHGTSIIDQREVGFDTATFRRMDYGRHCGKIPMSSSWEKCVTWKRFRQRLQQRKQVISSLRHYIHGVRHRQSIGLLTYSRMANNLKFVSSLPAF